MEQFEEIIEMEAGHILNVFGEYDKYVKKMCIRDRCKGMFLCGKSCGAGTGQCGISGTACRLL